MRYILHADDDDSDRWAFKYLVNKLDPAAKVVSFANGLELAQHLETMKEELAQTKIFLDIGMPIWDGIRTLKALQREPRYASIPVYLWSAGESQSDKDLCLKLGARQFLAKPTKPEEWETAKEELKKILDNKN